jgi:hypothetical protein
MFSIAFLIDLLREYLLVYLFIGAVYNGLQGSSFRGLEGTIMYVMWMLLWPPLVVTELLMKITNWNHRRKKGPIF